MSEEQKYTIDYSSLRDHSMDLAKEDAAAEHAQNLEYLEKIDPNIPPMPDRPSHIPNPSYDPSKPLGKDGNWPEMVDPLCDQARWWCQHYHLPLLEEDLNNGVKTAFWRALTLTATHQVAPPSWLADEILSRFGEKAEPKKIDKDALRKAVTPERALEVLRKYEEIETKKKRNIATAKIDAARLRREGKIEKNGGAKDKEQEIADLKKLTQAAIADKLEISLAQLKRLLKLARQMEKQKDRFSERLP